MNWKNIAVAKADSAPIEPSRPALNPSIEDLEAAAKRWDERITRNAYDSFAQGKNFICRDIAAKLRHFGSYASEGQRLFAQKLVDWSLPRERVWADPHAHVPTNDNGQKQYRFPEILVPDLFAVMQKFAKARFGDIVVARKNQDSLCWIKLDGCEKVVGRIVDGKAQLWPARMSSVQLEHVKTVLDEVEQNPLEAAMKYGKLSGRCCMCGRDLTDPVSIERGIGPICLNGFGN